MCSITLEMEHLSFILLCFEIAFELVLKQTEELLKMAGYTLAGRITEPTEKDLYEIIEHVALELRAPSLAENLITKIVNTIFT
ncbi:hypothetical protein ACI2OX_17340 [Bacillus sp. N9]